MTHAVHCHHGQSVCYGMAALHSGPGLALSFLLIGGVGGIVADGGGVDEQLGSPQSHDACSLGIPLVPAYHHPQPSHAGLYGLESEIAGCEIEFFIVARVVGYVHLAVFAAHRAVVVKHHGSVMVQSSCPALKQ